MLQTLKNKGRALSLVVLLGACTPMLNGCITPTYNNRATKPNPKLDYAIQEAIQRRNKAYANNPFVPTEKSLYKSQDLSTVGEQNPDFKGMPYPEQKTWDQQAEERKGRDNQPMGLAPWNEPPGYYK